MTVGSELSKARIAQGLSLADVAAQTRVRASLLGAMEADDFGLCGGAVYARGHIRSFAAVVGLDAAPLIADYDAHHESVPVPVLSEALPSRSMEGIRERSRPNWLAYGVGATAVLTLALGATYLGHSGDKTPRTTLADRPVVPSAAPALPPSAAPAPTKSAAPVLAQRPPVDVELKITKAPGSWVQELDGQGAFATVLKPGSTKIFTSQTGVKLSLGNAGAVDVTVNGKHLGLLGKDGEVLPSLAFGPEGITSGKG